MDTSSDGIFIDIDTEQFHIDPIKIKRIATSTCCQLGLRNYELSLNFVSSQAIHELNLSYRKKDRSTDVLSFPQQSWQAPLSVGASFADTENQIADAFVQGSGKAMPLLLGDLVISLEDAQINAHNIGHNLDREVCFLIIHGLLHLCGHDHEEAEEEHLMLGEQRLLMEILTTTESPPMWSQCVEPKAGHI